MEICGGLTLGGLHRHKTQCLETLFAEKRDQQRAGLLKDVDELKEEIRQTKEDFIDNPQARVQLIARRKEAIELEAKLTGAFVKDAPNPADHNDLLTKKLKELGYDETVQSQVRSYAAEHRIEEAIG